MLDTPHQVVSEDIDVNEVIIKFSLMKTHTYQLGNTHIYIYIYLCTRGTFLTTCVIQS